MFISISIRLICVVCHCKVVRQTILILVKYCIRLVCCSTNWYYQKALTPYSTSVVILYLQQPHITLHLPYINIWWNTHKYLLFRPVLPLSYGLHNWEWYTWTCFSFNKLFFNDVYYLQSHTVYVSSVLVLWNMVLI